MYVYKYDASTIQRTGNKSINRIQGYYKNVESTTTFSEKHLFTSFLLFHPT
jgi:hypothetical protein